MKVPFFSRLLVFGLFFFLISLPGQGKIHAAAMDHSSHGSQDAPAMTAHEGMSMDANSIMLGQVTTEGVTAMAHLNDVGAMMAKMGMPENYHLMLMFTAADGKTIDQGSVAVKITAPGKQQPGEALPMTGMDGHFGVDLHLPEPGEYQFTIGSKLADGQKRQFSFSYTVK